MIKLLVTIEQPDHEQLRLSVINVNEDTLDSTRLERLFAALVRGLIAKAIEECRTDGH